MHRYNKNCDPLGDGDVAARRAHLEGWEQARFRGMVTGTPVYFKQPGNVLARELGLNSIKGDDIEDLTRTLGQLATSPFCAVEPTQPC